ncbi:hypothetical protein BOX15_Mlig019212g2 [Macrostomum lignano]|uniref:C2 domain-containing protein n=1 Tax=Macrostomum lignano TaxID=282301 RepID=A0A267EV27_9PLAT|nr:hypothetical protein BOX15_Mlig019212g2 [Macrostomum lignano]
MPSAWEQEILGDNASSQRLQMLLMYLIVAASVLLAYGLGCLGFSGAWPTLLLAVLFHLWRVRVARLTQVAVQRAALLATRRRAMSGAESAEWLNFLVNRWWAFSAESIQSAVKRSLDYQLQQRRPGFLQSISLERFSLGEDTPCVRELRSFETTEADQSLMSATWANAGRPPQEVYRSSKYRLVLEAQLELQCDQFRMDFATRISRLGLGPTVSFGQLSLSGRLQLCVQLDLTARFPHVAMVTAAFKERPDVWFSLRITRAVNVAFVPVLRQWLRQAVEESLTTAMVDPGELVLYASQDPMAPLAADPADPDASPAAAGARPIRGVLTVTLRISKASAGSASPAKKSSEATGEAVDTVEDADAASSGIRICTISLGKEQRLVSREFPAGSACTQAASFFVRDLASEELHIHLKSKSLFGGVAPVAKWIVPLNEQPLKSTKIVQIAEVQRSSSLNAQLEYTELPDLKLESVQPTQVYSVSGALFIKVHGASNLLGMDRTGQSDPYCVVFVNRRKIGSTSYVKQTKNPKFNGEFNAFVADYTKTTVSFFLYDYDGRNALRDDFLGACHVTLQKENSTLLFHQLPLGYSVAKHGQVASNNMGNLLFSIVFRPVPSVAKSELAKANSGQLTDTELMNLQCADASNNRASVSSEEGAKRDGTADDSYSMNAGAYLAKGLGVMEFNLLGAKELMAMDRGGTSDPFVELRIGDEMLFRSKVSKATLEPRWNEWVTTRCPRQGEQLKVTVWDKDRIGKDFLGDLLLTLEEIRALSDSASTRWFNLSGKSIRSGQIELGCKIVSEGLAGAAVEKSSAKSKSSDRMTSSLPTGPGLNFTLHSARNLLGGKSVDAFVKVTSSANAAAEIFRTRTEDKSDRPYWGQKFSAAMGTEPIVFSVNSKSSFGKNDCIGSVELNLEAIACLSTATEPVWHKLTDEKGQQTGELCLECTMSSEPTADASAAAASSSKSKYVDKSVEGRPVTFSLVAGKKLMAADLGGTSDPFVRVTIGNRLLYKSQIVKGSLNPQWNEEFTVPVPKKHAVTFTVMDYDAVGKNDYLGEVSLDPVTASTLGETWYQLTGPKVKSGEILLSCRLPESTVTSADLDEEIDVDNELVPPSEVFEDATVAADSESAQAAAAEQPDVAPHRGIPSMSASSTDASPASPPAPTKAASGRQKTAQKSPSYIELTIVSGSNLMAADFGGTSDPYVVATVAGRRVHKTRVCRSTLNPVWRESVHLPLPDQGHLLRLATYDKDPVGKDDFLGEISLTRDNLLQMCQLKDDSMLKLAGKNVTSGHLLVRCRRSPGVNVGRDASGANVNKAAAAAAGSQPNPPSSFSEDLQQLTPAPSVSGSATVATSGGSVTPIDGGIATGDSRSTMELLNPGDSVSIGEDAAPAATGGTFQCDLLSLSGIQKLPRGERIYIKIKGDTSRRGGIGGRDLYKTRSYDLPASPDGVLNLDSAESFRLNADSLSTLSVLLKSSNKHKNIDLSSHSVPNLVARAGGPPVGVALPECGASLALRLTMLPPASDGSGGGGSGGGFGSLLRRRAGSSKKSGFRNSAHISASSFKDETGSNV